MRLARDLAPLRPCLLSAHYPPRSTEGIARHTELLARGLAELGHDVHVVTLGEEPSVVRQDGVYVHAVPFVAEDRYREFRFVGFQDLWYWLRWSHAAWLEVRALIEEHRVQIVDSPLWNLDGFVSQVAGRLPVVIRIATAMRQISRIHGRIDPERELIGDLEQRFLSRADGWIPNSQASVESLRTTYGLELDGRLLPVVPHGMVPVEERSLVERPRGGEVRVLFVGRLEARKGIRELLEAIPEVLRRQPQVRFQIAGADNSGEDGFKNREGGTYEAVFRKAFPELADRVEFLGWVPEERLEHLYRDCDLFVGPSLYESFGLIYTEAMNRGKPVIACRAGGAAEIVVDGETGLLVPPGDGPALAEAISALAGDPVTRRTMGREGRRRFMARYTHVAMARSFEDCYRQVIERHVASGGTP